MFLCILLVLITSVLPEEVSAQDETVKSDLGLLPLAPSYSPVTGIHGNLAIAGSNTMYPLMVRLAAKFKQYYPQVQIGVKGEGSMSVSIEDAARGLFRQMVQRKTIYTPGDAIEVGDPVIEPAQIMTSSRKLSASEFETFQSRYGYQPTEIPVALEAVAIYVHRANPLRGLSLDQIDAIFSETHRRGMTTEITEWGQLGLSEGWRNAPLHLYGRDRQSGTRDFFQERALLGGAFRSTIAEIAGSATLILAVAQDQLGIGYGGIGYQNSFVRALPLAPHAGGAFVAPTAESVTDGSYPLTRKLFLYIDRKPTDRLNPVLLEFLKFANSREGQEVVVKAGVYALPIAQARENLTLLNGTAVSTDNRSRE